MSKTEERVGLGDDSVQTFNFERFKGRKGEVQRIAIISPKLTRAYVHYGGEVLKKTFRCLGQGEFGQAPFCCERFGAPNQRFAVLLFKYTSEDGEILNENECRGKYLYWVFTENRYAALTDLHKGFPVIGDGWKDSEGKKVQQHDILVRCEDDAWQRITMTVCREAHWRKKEEWYKTFMDVEAKAFPMMQKIVGTKMEESELKGALSVGDLHDSSVLKEQVSQVDLDKVLK